jgi:hypothetical protein
MANVYKFHVKKIHGKLSKKSDTLYAKDISDACFKFVDMVDHKIVDQEYSYIASEISMQTSGSSGGHTVLKFYNKGEPIEAFIERVNDNIFKG